MNTARIAALAAAAFIVQRADASEAQALCVDPDKSYEAKAVSPNDVVARNTLGKKGPALRLTTSCTSLNDIDRISLSTSYACMGKGDAVVATAANGRRESCIVTTVAPYVPEGDGAAAD